KGFMAMLLRPPPRHQPERQGSWLSMLAKTRAQGDMLVFDEVVQSRHTVQTALAGLLETALFELVIDHCPVIDPHGAGLQFTGDPQGTVEVTRPQAGGDAELAVVGQLDRLRLAVEYLQRQHRPEGLLLDDGHLRIADPQQRRPIESPLGQRAFRHRPAAYDDLRAAGDRLL